MILSKTPYFFIVFLILISAQLSAQIIPPTSVCVRTDSIFFEIPTEFCGDFEGYVLFGSNTENGMYDIIDTIFDMNQTVYFHPNPDGLTWYYYMQTNADCGGQIPLNSDTINNVIPELVQINYVSVDGNEVEIDWDESTSTQIVGYVVKRVTDLGTVSVDTVFNTSFYTDTQANPDSQPEVYYILGIDACGNTSIFDNPHFTTHLTSSIDICERRIELAWNPYQNWTEGIEKQELWLSINGATPQIIAELDASIDTFIFENANDADTYCFYIEGIENNTGFISRSNELCQTVDIIQPNNDLVFTNVTIDDNNEIQVSWYWNDDAELEQYQLSGSINGVEQAAEVFMIADPLTSINTYTDPVLATDSDYMYNIQTTDDCGDVVETMVDHIYLQGTPLPNRDNQLFWTMLDIPNALDVEYELYRIENLTSILVSTTTDDLTELTDVFDASRTPTANTCYYVEAVANIVLPDGSLNRIRSRSNTTCVIQEASIRSPNAFTPNGKNPIFKPRVDFGDEVLSYKMLIFDRWGGLVFESNEVEQGWNGRNRNGKDMPQGVYTFMIQLQQASGAFLEDKGALMLLR